MEYVIGVGSNRGDRLGFLRAAWALLPPRIRGVKCAPIIETPAFGGPSTAGPFLNSAWLVETALGPHQLLLHLQRIEEALGRVRSMHFGPRTIDLDILLAEDGYQVENDYLTLPHPEMLTRDFVMIPVLAIAREWIHPIARRPLWQLFPQELN